MTKDMSKQLAKTEVTGLGNDTAAKSIKSLMPAIRLALPKHITPDRMSRIVLTAIRKNPDLLKCTQESLFGGILEACQLGLEINSPLQQAYLIPFNDKNKGTKEATLVIGYRGMIDLMYRNPKVAQIIVRNVYEGDDFEFIPGITEETYEHKTAEQKEIETGIPVKKGGYVATYMIVRTFTDNPKYPVIGTIFPPIYKAEMDKIRKRSKAGNSGPWVTDFEAMAKKSAVRKYFKFIPHATELPVPIRDESVLKYHGVLADNELDIEEEIELIEEATDADVS